MHSTRKIIRAFLASPGDLQEERKAIRGVVDEFNESWANELGYQIELVGWEETVAGYGRPQHLINQDLDRCDLFLGMIWKRWGTPPDHAGGFSSGFQEEFERSMVRREETGSPEIALFFKEIPEDFMLDPGDDLKKVLDFREKIIACKKVLFQRFSIAREMETLARKCITSYVNQARAKDESSEPSQLQAKRSQSDSGKSRRDNKQRESSQESVEGFEFLKSLLERFNQQDSLDALSASEVARFRLLANSISRPGNEEMNLGVHDINILFAAYIEEPVLSSIEIYSLVRLGFQHLSSENVPLWRWYSALSDSRFDPAVVSSFLGVNENEKVGAISVLTALDIDLPLNNPEIHRDLIIREWFSDDASVRVRTAALGYLAKCGTAGDLEIAKKEYDRSDQGTSRSALECMLRLLLRTGQVKSAQELVLESQFESIDANLLKSVIKGFEGMETHALHLGLEHHNPKIRLRAIEALHTRGELDIGMAERLSGDSHALVRRKAIDALLKLGKALGEEEIKNILVPPQKQTGSWGIGLVGSAGTDAVGEKLFKQYQLDSLKKLPEENLEERVRKHIMFDDAAYFALMERYFSNHAGELRQDVDDRFNTFFNKRIGQMEAAYGDSSLRQDLVKKLRDLEGFLRKCLTRQGLNVLCTAQKPEDLDRIRANLRDGYAGTSKLDAEYLGRHGEWTDIPILVNADNPLLDIPIPTISGLQEFQVEVAKAITSIGKRHPISDLLSIEMPAAVLKMVIGLCSESRFAQISRDALLALFNHKSDQVRKAAAVLSVRAFPAKRIKSILREYVSSDNYRYYNVIHWLDLGASMRRYDAKKIARSVEI